MSVETLRSVLTLAGADQFEVEALNDVWPALIRLRSPGQPIRVGMHVGPIGKTHRGRDDIERRFQNPGQNRPISEPANSLPILIGLSLEANTPVLAAMDPYRRMGRQTRQSFFVSLQALEEGSLKGWTEYLNSKHERIFVFHPALLPTYIRLLTGEIRDIERIPDIVEASGLASWGGATSVERVRRLSSTLIRRAAFAHHVIAAYDGECAMCGLDLGLVEAAHIYPAHAPQSPDLLANGLALCRNHHAAFDLYKIWVDPYSAALKVDPTWTPFNATSKGFLLSTLNTLRLPHDLERRPSADMFLRRYAYYSAEYSWAK